MAARDIGPNPGSGAQGTDGVGPSLGSVAARHDSAAEEPCQQEARTRTMDGGIVYVGETGEAQVWS